jgi:hypothetical protein
MEEVWEELQLVSYYQMVGEGLSAIGRRVSTPDMVRVGHNTHSEWSSLMDSKCVPLCDFYSPA